MSDYAIVATTTRLCQHPLCQRAPRQLHRRVQLRSLSSAAAPARAKDDDPPPAEVTITAVQWHHLGYFICLLHCAHRQIRRFSV